MDEHRDDRSVVSKRTRSDVVARDARLILPHQVLMMSSTSSIDENIADVFARFSTNSKNARQICSVRTIVDDVGAPCASPLGSLFTRMPWKLPGDSTEPLEEAQGDPAKSEASKKYQPQREIDRFFVPQRYDPLNAKAPDLQGRYVPPPPNVLKDHLVLPRTEPKPFPEPTRAHPADPDDSQAQAKPNLPPEL